MDPITGVLETKQNPGRFTDLRLVAVNYGTRIQNQMRGIQDGKSSWVIDFEDRSLNRGNLNLLYDGDKIVDRVILENGSPEDIIKELRNFGYEVRE